MRSLTLVFLVVFALAAAGCSMTSKATNFNGLKDFDGNEVEHLNTTNIALNGLFVYPLLGNASLEETVACHTQEAKEAGALKVRLVQSDSSTYWWILPPISFFIQPVVTTVAGDAITD